MSHKEEFRKAVNRAIDDMNEITARVILNGHNARRHLMGEHTLENYIVSELTNISANYRQQYAEKLARTPNEL